MKSRSAFVTYMEIIGALTEGPKLPTRLAQACNLNFKRLMEFAGELEAKGYIKRGMIDGHEVFSVTSEGLTIHGEFEGLRAKLAI